MVDAYATEPHFLAHIAPIWHALEPDERGTFWVGGTLASRAMSEGVAPVKIGRPPNGTTPTLAASFQDRRVVAAAGRPVVYLEHGAGQTYLGDPAGEHASYSGGPEHEGTVLFLTPSETVADRWRARYPALAVAIGCPRLDAFHAAGRAIRGSTHGCVAISFHSAVRLVPETYSALPHYSAGLRAAVEAIRALGLDPIGHAHPRLWGRLGPVWRSLGVEPVEDFAEVLARAALYACDNSSTLYEAASVGIPVVVMNAPWFRRDVHHGLRFWNMIPGIECDSAEELPDAVVRALADPPEIRDRRERIVREVYAYTDGRAAQRAVIAIRALALATA